MEYAPSCAPQPATLKVGLKKWCENLEFCTVLDVCFPARPLRHQRQGWADCVEKGLLSRLDVT
jgi:hypothetical protein